MEEFAKKHPPYGGIIHVLLLAIIAAAVGVGWLVRYTPSADSMYSILVNAAYLARSCGRGVVDR